MSKDKARISFINRFRKSQSRLALSLISAIVLCVGAGPKLVHAVSCTSASDCEAQINNLSNQSAQDQQTINNLESQAQSYDGAISALNSQITDLQQQISSNEAEQASLQQQIAANQQEIAAKKSTLSDDIQTMYEDGQMSTVEELATSQNLSDFVDKQEYQSVVQDQLASIIQQISVLEQSLQNQKTQVSQLVATDQAQYSQLSDAQAQQQQLLGYNQSQQAAYNQQIASASSNINQLKAQLTALNNAGGSAIISGGVCGGGYPTSTKSSVTGEDWGCDLPQDNTQDNWGMDNRECVSYTAFMVHEEYLSGEVAHDMPNWGGEGNAYEWISDAESAGIPVSQTPEPGDIAIRSKDWSDPEDVGHAMYVISVQSPTEITVGEYNEHYNGTYDERQVNTQSYANQGTPVYYLHFQQWQ